MLKNDQALHYPGTQPYTLNPNQALNSKSYPRTHPSRARTAGEQFFDVRHDVARPGCIVALGPHDSSGFRV